MLNDLSVMFFREFARYEYCLKATGLMYGEKEPHANWDKYAVEVAHIFQDPQQEELKEAIDYFLKYPPKKQIIKDGVLAWDDAPSEEKNVAVKIFVLIRRVRNNLFHGGKFNGTWFDAGRSEALISHALTILKVCGESHDKVSKAYAGKNS